MGFELLRNSCKPLWDRKAGQRGQRINISHFSSETANSCWNNGLRIYREKGAKRKMLSSYSRFLKSHSFSNVSLCYFQLSLILLLITLTCLKVLCVLFVCLHTTLYSFISPFHYYYAYSDSDTKQNQTILLSSVHIQGRRHALPKMPTKFLSLQDHPPAFIWHSSMMWLLEGTYNNRQNFLTISAKDKYKNIPAVTVKIQFWMHGSVDTERPI